MTHVQLQKKRSPLGCEIWYMNGREVCGHLRSGNLISILPRQSEWNTFGFPRALLPEYKPRGESGAPPGQVVGSPTARLRVRCVYRKLGAANYDPTGDDIMSTGPRRSSPPRREKLRVREIIIAGCAARCRYSWPARRHPGLPTISLLGFSG